MQYSITGWNGIRFDNFAQSNGSDVYAILTSAFLPPATGKFTYTFRPGTNNDAVQFAAMTGVLLKRESESLSAGGHGLGLVGGQYYIRSRASGGPCQAGTSCTSGVTCYISTTLRNGSLPSHYKSLVTHEIAHAVQYQAMGVP